MCLLFWLVTLLPSLPIFEEMFLMMCQVFLRENSLLKIRRETKKHLPSRLLYLESPGGSCLMVELLIPDDGFTPSEWQCLPGSMHWANFLVFSQGC